MTGSDVTATRGKRSVGRVVAVSSSLVGLILFGCYLLAAVYLRTPAAARQVSRFLSDYLTCPVAVARLGLAGGTFSVDGLAIGNPAGFPGGELASSRSITITPAWWDLLRGRRNFAEIGIRGLKISLGRNGEGAWNFAPLARRLSGKKGGGETLVRHLSVSQASLAVEGFRIDDLALNVTDLATKGTSGSRLLLTGKDAAGNPFRLEGNARLGTAPSAEVAVAAPSFSLRSLGAAFRRPELSHGRGALSLNLKLRDGELAVRGRLAVERLPLAVKGEPLPLAGELAFAGRYDTREDEAFLDDCSVRVDGGVRVRASGTVRQVRTKRSFAAAVSFDPVDIAALSDLMPQRVRLDLAPAGRLSGTGFRFSGNAAGGITAGGGKISLSGGAVSKGGRTIVRDLAATVSLIKMRDGWRLRGKAGQGEGGGDAMVQGLAVPFAIDFSNRFAPVRGEVPSFAAAVMGFPVEGKAAYRSGVDFPLTFRVDVRKAPLPALNRYLAGKNVAFAGGTAALSFQGAARSPREFRGKVAANVAALRGKSGGTEFSVKEGVTEAGVEGSGGKLSATGRIGWTGGTVGGRKVDFASTFGVHDGEWYLTDGTVTAERAALRLARVRGKIPVPVRAGGVTRLPLRLEFSGVAAHSGAVGMEGVAGALAADYLSGDGGRRLEGGGTIAVRKFFYKEQEIGSAEGGVRLTGSGAALDIHGRLLDGRLAGTVHTDPFDRDRKTAFSISLDQARCALLAPLEPVTLPVRVTSGSLGAKLTGSYGHAKGVQWRLEADSRELALAGKGGKTLLTGGSVRMVADLARDTLSVREGVVYAGKTVALTATGALAHPFSPGREGDLSLSLATTPLDALRTAFVTVLPTALQEASVAGTIGAEGRIRAARGEATFDGRAVLNGGRVEVPSQRLTVNDMTGTIPVSLVLTGGPAAGRPGKQRYSRDNFPALLAALRRGKAGQTFTIGRVRFGGVELGKTSLTIGAENGLVEVRSVSSSLFDGALLGEGFFRYGKTVTYGVDLIVNDMSLRALCSAYPKIKGYISGKVDGIVSLYGEGSGMKGVRGFTDIWTRSAPGEKRQVSKEFLQKLAGRKLKGIFFRNDRPYDRGEIRGFLENGYLTFDTLDISHTNFFGIRDLSVTVAPVQNRIAIGHLIASIREAATRGKAVGTGEVPPQPPADTEFKWQE